MYHIRYQFLTICICGYGIVCAEQRNITASNALVKLLRLQQLTSGFLRLDETENPMQISAEKQDVLTEVLEEIDTKRFKVVIFTKFVHDLNVVERVANEMELSYGEISGRRKDLSDDATFPDGVTILGVQIQAGGLGIDLSDACYAIYYSMGFSLGDYEQSKARLHRPGQTNRVTNIHLLARDTIDFKVYGALRSRQEVVNSILNRKDLEWTNGS